MKNPKIGTWKDRRGNTSFMVIVDDKRTSTNRRSAYFCKTKDEAEAIIDTKRRFKPEIDTPQTKLEAKAFWEHWGMKNWFHPDDTYDDLPELNVRINIAWDLYNPWCDDMDEFWDRRSKAMYESMGMEVRE